MTAATPIGASTNYYVSGAINRSYGRLVNNAWIDTNDWLPARTAYQPVRLADWYVPIELTPEQLEGRVAAQVAERTLVAERVEAARLEFEEARIRAEEFLARCLSTQQRRWLKRYDYFYVTGSAGGRYRIRRGYAGNIDEIGPDRRVVATLCAHPDVSVPVGDSMATQKLWIETDEARFRKIANIRKVAA